MMAARKKDRRDKCLTLKPGDKIEFTHDPKVSKTIPVRLKFPIHAKCRISRRD